VTDTTTSKATTNTTANSCVDVQCDCNALWSMAQQFSYLRLSDKTAPFRATLLTDYGVRARRIAATYARYYLEQEDGSDPAKKGRFYWMALGAFASKTVACTLEAWQVKLQAATISKTTKEGLGKGNFWLFCDISGWHWYYCKFPASFDTCIGSRNAQNFVPAVKSQVAKLPWSQEALPKIKQFAVSPYIRSGFAKVKEFEAQDQINLRRQIQFDNLMEIANHEQGVILQPLIYDDPKFAYWIQKQRSVWINWASPGLELVFSNACSSSDGDFKSVAPDDTVLEDFTSRMKWITKAANMFHGLMIKKRSHMERELAAIAGWVDLADR
jgi:hypothetical protein